MAEEDPGEKDPDQDFSSQMFQGPADELSFPTNLPNIDPNSALELPADPADWVWPQDNISLFKRRLEQENSQEVRHSIRSKSFAFTCYKDPDLYPNIRNLF